MLAIEEELGLADRIPAAFQMLCLYLSLAEALSMRHFPSTQTQITPARQS